MRISNKLQKLVSNGLITPEQAEKIMSDEKKNNAHVAWRLMCWLAGLLIGLGFVLIVSSNWDGIPAPVKLVGDFAIWAAILYGTYWSVVNKKTKTKELFLTLSALFVGATIGLIAQIFHLQGGWNSFALLWAILSVGFVLCSKLISLNFLWLCLLFSAINLEFLFRWFVLKFGSMPVVVLVVMTLCYALLTYAGDKIYNAINKVIVLPKAFAVLCFLKMYLTVIGGGVFLGFMYFWAKVFVFAFLGIRLLMALSRGNLQSFVRNTHLVELYILFLFVTYYRNLFMSGVGFIAGGVLLLLTLFLLKRTSSYIKAVASDE